MTHSSWTVVVHCYTVVVDCEDDGDLVHTLTIIFPPSGAHSPPLVYCSASRMSGHSHTGDLQFRRTLGVPQGSVLGPVYAVMNLSFLPNIASSFDNNISICLKYVLWRIDPSFHDTSMTCFRFVYNFIEIPFALKYFPWITSTTNIKMSLNRFEEMHCRFVEWIRSKCVALAFIGSFLLSSISIHCHIPNNSNCETQYQIQFRPIERCETIRNRWKAPLSPTGMLMDRYYCCCIKKLILQFGGIREDILRSVGCAATRTIVAVRWFIAYNICARLDKVGGGARCVCFQRKYQQTHTHTSHANWLLNSINTHLIRIGFGY